MFRKNIDAIQVKSFKDKICAIKKPNLYKVVLGKDPLDINFVDLRDNKKIYKNPIKDLEDMLKKYDVEYRYYKVLTFYGFGNTVQGDNFLLQLQCACIYHTSHILPPIKTGVRPRGRPLRVL